MVRPRVDVVVVDWASIDSAEQSSIGAVPSADPQHRQIPFAAPYYLDLRNRMRNLERNMAKTAYRIVKCVGRSQGGILMSLVMLITNSLYEGGTKRSCGPCKEEESKSC